jgi:hypothetical protein
MRIGRSWAVAGVMLAMMSEFAQAQETAAPATPPAAQQPAPAEPPEAAPAPAAPAAPTWTLKNTRKVYKAKWRVVNLFLSACEYGVYGYGDQLVGGRVERVEKRLREHFGDRLNGHQVVLDRYEFFQNAQINLIHATGAFTGGIIGGAMESSYNLNCKRKDTKSGWYDTKMFPPDPAPYVVEIAVKVDGQVVAASAAASPARAHTFKEADLAEPEIAAVIGAVQEVAIDDLIRRIDPLIPKP